MPFKPGDCLHGRYRIETLLGEGGMGSVYRAFDLLNDHPCAVKEFRLGHLPGEEEVTRFHETALSSHSDRKRPQITREKAVEQFQREAKLLAKLEYPHLPKVTDYFAVGDDQYLVMTLIEGRDLAQILDEATAPLSQDRVLGWMRQVLDALSYCHREGVVHRDVKPANVIVTEGGEAFLVDFGIAKPEAADGKTTIGARATTPGYSPPEQYGGQGQTDVRSDIYALGATMYALLTGRQPADAIQRLDQEMPGVRRLRPDISPRVEHAIWKALALRRDDRFPSIKEMTEALYGGSFAAAVTTALRILPTRTRYPLGVAIVASMLVLLIAFGRVVTGSMVQHGGTSTMVTVLPDETAPNSLETVSFATLTDASIGTFTPQLVSPALVSTKTATRDMWQSSRTSTATVTRLVSELMTPTPALSATYALPSRTMTPLTVTPPVLPSLQPRSTVPHPLPPPTVTQQPPPPTVTQRPPPPPTVTQQPPPPPTVTQQPPPPTVTQRPPPTATQQPPPPTVTQRPPPTAFPRETPVLPTVPVKTLLPTRDLPTVAPPDT